MSAVIKTDIQGMRIQRAFDTKLIPIKVNAVAGKNFFSAD